MIVNDGVAPVVSIMGGFAESRAVSKSLYLQAGVARSLRPFGLAALSWQACENCAESAR